MTRPEQAVENRFESTARLPQQVFKRADELAFAFTDSALLTALEDGGLEGMRSAFQRRFHIRSCRPSPFDERVCLSLSSDESQAGGDSRTLHQLAGRKTEQRRWSSVHRCAYRGFHGIVGEMGLWIDQDQELAVLGAPRTQLVSVAERQVDGFEWVSASDVADLLAPSFYPEPVSAEFWIG